MKGEDNKICHSHLERLAVVYVRQSTPQQVLSHRESTEIQYRLRERAQALGWSSQRILTIDDDLGVTGTSVEGRVGFQRLLGEIGLQHVGIVLGIEMSRLARSCRDWYQLLELCAMFGSLLGDNDGIYNPADYNDRLLLGLKGTISEAELHLIKNRLLAGKRNKAMKCALRWRAPVGYILTERGFEKDPDEQVQSSVFLIFDEFERLGSLNALLHYLCRNGIRLGIRRTDQDCRGDLEWHRPNRATLQNLLHNPIYAGTYAYGRRRVDLLRRKPGRPATGRVVRDAANWLVCENGKLPAYITWERFMSIQERLHQNRSRFDSLVHPRGGKGLLSGLVLCGRCGHRMMTTVAGPHNSARYTCDRLSLDYGLPRCQSLQVHALDGLVEQEVIRVLEPASLELAIQAQCEVEREKVRLNRDWEQRIERARIDCERAKRQYDRVEPENRLVARELERTWNEKLNVLRETEENFDRAKADLSTEISPCRVEEIRTLSQSIPNLLRGQSIKIEDKKEIVRLLIEHVIINVDHSEKFKVQICWKGGRTSHYNAMRPVQKYEQLSNWKELQDIVSKMRTLGFSAKEIAEHLNKKKFLTPKRVREFSAEMVRQIIVREKINPRPVKRPWKILNLGSDECTIQELGHRLNIPVSTLFTWARTGWILSRRIPERGKQRVILSVPPDELDRLQKLRKASRGWPDEPYPKELTTPKAFFPKKEEDHAAQGPNNL